MVPEKGRNAGTALRRELGEAPYDFEWLDDIINERGKRAAKTGEGFEGISQQVQRVAAGSDTLDIALKEYGRDQPRPVFDHLELTDRRIEGFESPADAWHGDCLRFYAGYDSVLEALLDEGADIELAEGFEAAVEAGLQERGYERVEAIGDAVNWAVMTGADTIPADPRVVLVPAGFSALGARLAGQYFGTDVAVRTFEEYAAERDGGDADEEALLAAAGDDVAGVYMYVSGSTAEAHGLTYEAVPGATSRLGVFQRPSATTMTRIESLKGFYDRLPGEFSAWREVIDTVEETAREFGFREINTPAVERTDLYRVKSGEELLDQTYSFTDRGDREVTLTPEQTPTRARIAQKRKDLKLPVKWFDTSKRWRYEDVQRGRDREFFQTDIDIVGIESVEADAEVIACGARIYEKLGVADQVEFLVNDRRLLEALLEAEGVGNTTEVMRVVDDKEKLDRTEFFDALADFDVDRATAERVDELTAIRGPIVETVEELRARAPDDERVTDAVDRMESLADALDSYGVADRVQLDLAIVRGLAYYTGLVFEAFDTAGELRALFGGGRYDDLIGLFGDREMPAVGFAFGYSTTRELLEREGEWPAEAVDTDAYVLAVSGSVRDEALATASDLRDRGLVVETDLAGRSVGSQFGYADDINADQVVVVGERDLSEGVLTVRNMDSGEEQTVDVDEVPAFVADRVRD
jgi:histidyl-tRNA synthetase